MPFCQRAFWLDFHLGPFSEAQNYGKDISLMRGTAVHACLQKWLGHANFLYGNWSCPLCEATLYDHLGWPGTCPIHTKADLVYTEYELRYKGFHGFADGLIPLANKAHYALLEAKTMKGSAWVVLKEPKKEHVLQANAYAGVFQRTYALDVKKLWLWYVNADTPYYDPKVFELDYDEKMFTQMLKTMEKIRVMRYKDRVNRPLTPPPGICTSTDRNPWCIAQGVCWSSNLTTILKEQGVATKSSRTNKGHS